MALSREQMAQRVAREMQDGFSVNLGNGMPTLVANYIPEGMEVMLQSENGLLGMGPFPTEETIDADMINAGKQTVTARIGASIFSSAESFAMIRGGHVDLTVLGAFEVDVQGNIAVIMTHASKDGESKLLSQCSLPLTGAGCIKRVLTDLAYLEIENGAFVLKERAPGVSVEEIVAKTAGKLIVPDHVPEMQFQ